MPDFFDETDKSDENDISTLAQNNSLTFDDKVIKKIAGLAINDISGILGLSGNFIAGIADKFRNVEDYTKGITVEAGKEQVSIGMKVICEYGQNMPKIFQNIVDKVTSAIKEMTGLDVIKVNVHVYDVLTKEDFERQSKKKQDEKLEIEAAPPVSTEFSETDLIEE